MTQCDRLLEYLRSGRSITPLAAWSELGIYRLASRVKDLENDGWTVNRKRVKVNNRFGEACNVAEYELPRYPTL